jgi:hypothetical protein
LLIKHLHKFYNKEDVPWVQLIWNTHYLDGQIPHASANKGSFWFKDIMKYPDHFRGIASATIGVGDTVLLWGDVWNGHHLMSELRRVFSFVRNKNISVAEYCSNQVVQQNFYTPLSQHASQELVTLNQVISQAQQLQMNKDTCTYIWGLAKYTSNKFYNLSSSAIQAPTPFKWIWDSKVSKKIKIFIWLLFRIVKVMTTTVCYAVLILKNYPTI